MKNTVTFGHILTILGIIIIPLIIWGANIEGRSNDNSKDIVEIKDDVSNLEDKDDQIINLIQKNQIEVISEFSDVKVLIEKNNK